MDFYESFFSRKAEDFFFSINRFDFVFRLRSGGEIRRDCERDELSNSYDSIKKVCMYIALCIRKSFFMYKVNEFYAFFLFVFVLNVQQVE